MKYESKILRRLRFIDFPGVCLYASLVLRFNDSVLWGDGKAVGRPGQLKAQLSV